MTDGERFVLFVTFWLCVMSAAFLGLFVFAGPPERCAYLVPVKGHPHVLACSSHPRRVKP